jgi:hypothetical protein
MLPRVQTRRLNVRAFPRDDDSLRSQAAELLVEAFPHANGWPTLALALAPTSHPLGFYLKIGFVSSGVVPDANGRGLPGILLARRLG